MQLPSYREALQMGKEKVAELLIPVRVNKARKKAELEMCELDEKIATKTEEVSKACTAEDVDFSALIRLQDDLAMLERRKKQYQTILDEMFPADE